MINREEMATKEHKELASVIKNTHALLREEYKFYGADEAWQRHTSRSDVLQKYSTSMKKLATTYWQKNNAGPEKSIYCRVEWIKTQCKEYFFNAGRQKYKEKELNIKHKINTDNQNITYNNPVDTDTNSIPLESRNMNEKLDVPLEAKISLLDVGSCYNPFGNDDMFHVTAIDLLPVSNTVLQCDFLKLNIGEKKVLSESSQELYQLPQSSFNVVVFSLLLEYLPCPEQRYVCCKKAYELLENEGILFIISPDSKHVGANAKFMKSWRYVLSKLGFMRIKYEKLRHVHCVAFRKCIFPDVPLRWAALQTFADTDALYQTNKIFIPQDFHSSYSKDEETNNVSDKYDVQELITSFSELPFTC